MKWLKKLKDIVDPTIIVRRLVTKVVYMIKLETHQLVNG